MQIVEIGDCSMVIMKDSEDAPWESVGNAYRMAVDKGLAIWVSKTQDSQGNYIYNDIHAVASDFVYTAGRLVLFFKKPLSNFYLHDRVCLHHTGTGRKY